MNKISKLAIANRGEVAVRIIHACRDMGITSVLLHSDADEKTMAYRMADETVRIGSSPVNESYLSIENNIAAAKSVGADAVHPGFGFLSENADFAQACADHRLIFVGPSPASIRLFGDKISAKILVEQLKISTVPGYQGADQELNLLIRKCDEIGYPVIIKASGGGGGRGLKVARNKSEAAGAIESAQREGQNAFGSSNVFIERYLDKAKHIEIQIFGDAKGQIFHLSERDCSVQRRHQKVIEEGPASMISQPMRKKLAEAAVKIASAAKYKGAGTVEFLVQGDEYFFIEMNTRLQVEHPVTELILGIDLVKAQILTAQDLPLSWQQDELNARGHSIECRLYAEDSYLGGIPSVGVLGNCHWQAGPGRRFEVGFDMGNEVTSFYDSMIAKIVVWDENRTRCIQKMKNALKETVIFGLKTNIPYLLAILDHEEFVDGNMTTQFIGKHFSEALPRPELPINEAEVRSLIANAKNSSHVSSAFSSMGSSAVSPWKNQNWRGN